MTGLNHCMACNGPCAVGRPACRAWQCEGHADKLCLVVSRMTGRPREPHPVELCNFHAENGDRRFTVVQVLDEIPTQAATAAVEKG